jgi:hypothetical protein
VDVRLVDQRSSKLEAFVVGVGLVPWDGVERPPRLGVIDMAGINGVLPNPPPIPMEDQLYDGLFIKGAPIGEATAGD